MSIVDQIKKAAAHAISALYNVQLDEKLIQVNATNPGFEGDYAVVLFGFIKQLKKSPDVLGNEIGNYLLQHNPSLFSSFNLVKGFLNLVVADAYWAGFLQANHADPILAKARRTAKR